MKYLWVEDSTSGYEFWNLVNSFYFQDEFEIEKSYGNSNIISRFEDFDRNDKLKITNNIHYIIIDTVPDNTFVMAKLENIEDFVRKYPNNIKMINIICFEYLILAARITFNFVPIKDKKLYQILQNILDNTIDFSINRSSLDKDSLAYIQSLSKRSTENVYKNLSFQLLCDPGWSINTSFGHCWYKDCCEDSIVSKRVQLAKLTNSEKFQKASPDIQEKMHTNIKKNLTKCLISERLMKGNEKLEQLLSCDSLEIPLNQLKMEISSRHRVSDEDLRPMNVF